MNSRIWIKYSTMQNHSIDDFGWKAKEKKLNHEGHKEHEGGKRWGDEATRQQDDQRSGEGD